MSDGKDLHLIQKVELQWQNYNKLTRPKQFFKSKIANLSGVG
jgi:hypothetical protein